MKTLLLLSFLGLTSFGCHAKKYIWSLEKIIATADLIVVGEITNLHTQSYDFSISRTLKGSAEEEICVRMFDEWLCDQRSKPAEVGQQLILFLEDKVGKYEILNGSTGELIVEGSIVETTVGQTYQPNLDDYTTLISDFLNCYAAEKVEDIYSQPKFTRIKEIREITAIKNSSEMHRSLFGRIEETINSKE